MSWSIVRLVVAASALVLVTASCALAQAGSSREAPVGHRQSKASEVPQEQQQLSDPDKKMKELDDALAKKLKGICRPGVHAVNALQEEDISRVDPKRPAPLGRSTQGPITAYVEARENQPWPYGDGSQPS